MKKYFLGFAALVLAITSLKAQDSTATTANSFEVDFGGFAVEGISTELVVHAENDLTNLPFNGELSAMVNGLPEVLRFENGQAKCLVSFDRNEPLSIKIGSFTHVQSVKPMPIWLSIISPLLVIILALTFKEVISSLAIGVISGAALIAYYTPDTSVWTALLRFVDDYILNALADRDHASVILFSMLIAATVAIVSRNGGMLAIVNIISKKVKSARSAQFSTWFMGIVIFFDDYANTLVVGNTMRPITDRMRISREKLSFIVDSTAAPVAGIAFITTWIGAELGYIDNALSIINASGQVLSVSAYSVFLNSLQYAYYPFLCLGFIVMLIFMNRDFGPMWKAENRARTSGVLSEESSAVLHSDFEPIPGKPRRAINAILPIGVLIIVTACSLVYTGYEAAIWQEIGPGFFQKLSITIGQANSYQALLWASFASLLTAVILTLGQGIMPLTSLIETTFDGFKSMISAMCILLLAWSLASVTENLHTGAFLSNLVSGNLAPWLLAPITLILAGMVSFSTGTAWGTMAILYPLILPLSWKLSIEVGLDVDTSFTILANCTASVLAGSLIGDHCSPISDTTILSSLASQCHHIDHVRTQLPYAVSIGIVSILLSGLSGLIGIAGWWMYPLGFLILYLLIRILGKPLPSPITDL